MTDIPHFRMPFGVENGRVAEVEQDTIEDVAGCVEVVLRVPQGHRDELPEFGTPDPTFTSPPDIGSLHRAVTEWEPRAESTVEDGTDAFEMGVTRLRMNVNTGEQNG